MIKKPQLNKESWLSNEQGISVEQVSQVNKGPQLGDSSLPPLDYLGA